VPAPVIVSVIGAKLKLGLVKIGALWAKGTTKSKLVSKTLLGRNVLMFIFILFSVKYVN